HLALDGLETIDLTLHLAVTPWGLDGRQDSREVLLQTESKTYQRSDATLLGALNPAAHLLAIAAGQRVAEVQRQHAHPRQLRASGGKSVKKQPLLVRQLIG